jgi:hypothetical protein
MSHDDAAEDRLLLARLRTMWERLDPPPAGLVEDVLLALATHDLATEYELLVLVESTDRLAGTRGSSDTRTLTFTGEDVTVMLRVSATGEGRRRVDGWLSPGSARAVLLRSGDAEWRTTSTEHGRFEIADVPAGEGSLRIEPGPQPSGTEPSGTEPSEPEPSEAEPSGTEPSGAARGLTTPAFPL